MTVESTMHPGLEISQKQAPMNFPQYWLSYYKQDGSISEDRLAGGNDWALAFVKQDRTAHGHYLYARMGK